MNIYAVVQTWIAKWHDCIKKGGDRVACDEEHMVTAFFVGEDGAVQVIDVDSLQKLNTALAMCNKLRGISVETCGRDICTIYAECGNGMVVVTRGVPGL